MKYELPVLPYALDALAPAMSGETLQYHYGKHHQTYINNLNSLIEGTLYQDKKIEEIIKSSEGVLFNNAAQTYNHTMFFFELSPSAKLVPTGKLSEAINRDFGSLELFKELFNKAAITQFGSGWAWLYKDSDGKLFVSQESNAGNPLRKGFIPIMNCDVWEHGYYIDYRNRRADFIEAFWTLLDWKVVERLY